ncbi:MAG: phosphoadenylyl-sulfate reductase [Brevundimonas sp.]|uniref:phosphoadenylyl-sulfate reductase n=1 Tax=Brevundimonas sp. TaxID=1871086 RepID=UPI000DB8166D|nr:phosphoadenylyl-sulfate reductase [Brevundimonas sp.]PZU00578.1 MAG: phosphoadenylyl-sulfate reductase [Brevundimonas sp.]
MLQTLEGRQNGLRLSVATPVDEVEAAAADEDVLVLEFDAFRDGRGFSLAAILRERGYAGRLIAAGKLLPDQARHLRRSGFDGVELGEGADAAAWARMDQAFSAAYQPAADPAPTIWRRRRAASNDPDLKALADRLNRETEGKDASEIVKAALNPALGLRVGAISSFGAESAVLLDTIARQNLDVPVVFLETGQHFLQTLSYRTQLTKVLGLTDVRLVAPDAGEKAMLDARDDLWKTDADACCDLRKVRPLARATAGFNALITGRKRYQAATRAALKPFEVLDGVLRINPLANWDAADVEAWLDDHDLPRHPLVEQGYRSIGCWPCTRAVQDGEDARAGRWSGMDKVECGIHLGQRQAAA